MKTTQHTVRRCWLAGMIIAIAAIGLAVSAPAQPDGNWMSMGGIPGTDSTVIAAAVSGSGIVASEEAWAREVVIGSLLLTEVPVTQATKADLASRSKGYQATLGLAALKRLHVIVDGKSGMAYLQAKDSPPAAYEHNRVNENENEYEERIHADRVAGRDCDHCNPGSFALAGANQS